MPLSLAALMVACGGGGESPPLISPPPIGDAPFACAGADLSVLQTTVFVSILGEDSPSCGSDASATCKSIQQGIANCNGAGCGVLVGQGTYDLAAAAPGLPRNVVMRDGVSVIGSCTLDGSTEPRYRSVLRGPAGLPAVSASAIASATLLQGFVVIGGSSSGVDGSASIAMAADASPALVLRQLQLIGGPGAQGATGQPGQSQSQGCETSGVPASCATLAGQPTGPQTGFFTQATWIGVAGGNGGAGTATGQSMPSGSELCSSGGQGGQQGGASIGLIWSNAALSLDPSVAIFASKGGDGGQGGAALTVDYGGAGAGGAGGNGGPSFGLVANQTSLLLVGDGAVFQGTPGAAGAFGYGGGGRETQCIGASGAAGRPGISVASYQVGSNWLTQGAGTLRGVGHSVLKSTQQIASPDATWFLRMQGDGSLELDDLGGTWWEQGGTLSPGSQLVWVTDSLCVVSSAWCAGGGYAPPQLPKEFGPDTFLAVEEGRIAIYNLKGDVLWWAGPY